MGRQNRVLSDGLVGILMNLSLHVENVWPVSQCLGEHWPALVFHMPFFSWDFKKCVGPSICSDIHSFEEKENVSIGLLFIAMLSDRASREYM